jgi:hypothetical protein
MATTTGASGIVDSGNNRATGMDLKSVLPYVISMIGKGSDMNALGILLGLWGMNELKYRQGKRSFGRENRGVDKVNGGEGSGYPEADNYGLTVTHADTSNQKPATGNVTPPADQTSASRLIDAAVADNFGFGNNPITESLVWNPERSNQALANGIFNPAAAAAPGTAANGLFGRLLGGQNGLNPNDLPQLFKVLGGQLGG